MNQVTKTMCFVGAAIATTVLAFASRPAPVDVDAVESGVAELCPEFKDPLAAKSLKIVRFDETLASLSEIEVKESNGIWTLPSHDGYPADAENRIRDATTPFIELTSLSSVSDNEGDHSLYGVLEPGADKSSVGDQGVGTLVTVENGTGEKLVNLIIGKEVKDNSELRYVRQPGRSRVYVAKVDPNNLPVRFEDWIEKDLLNLNSWDIQQLTLKDYSFQVAATLTGPVTDYDQRLEITVTDDNGKWQLDELLVADNDKLQPTELNEGEELNADRLNELKEALDGLEIVNVERKPANLGADLRADKGFANDQAGIESLLQRGFYPVSMPSGEVEVLSADGEVLVHTKEGVEYILRFGGIEGVDTESDEGKLNRFLLVTARVNDDHFPEPDLEALPETVEDLQQSQAPEAETDAQPNGTEASLIVPPQGRSAHPTLPVALLQEEAASDEAAAAEESTGAAAEQPAQEAEPDADAEASDVPTEPSSTAEESTPPDDDGQTPEAEPAADEAGSASESTESAEEEVDWEARLKAERERITKDNQRKIDERNDNLEKAREKVRELNYRFSDWYYVISEDVYKQIHLSQADIVRPVSAEPDADSAPGAAPSFGPGALEGLQGLQNLQAPGNQ